MQEWNKVNDNRDIWQSNCVHFRRDTPRQSGNEAIQLIGSEMKLNEEN
jgi:hypothetical protein